MTMERSKSNLLELLSDPENKVIALSGKWGTGKSYLWKDIQQSSQDEVLRNALYVSLFGLSTINELKLKILQEAIPHLDGGSSRAAAMASTLAATKRILRSFHAGFAALDELALLAAPIALRDRFIVIDDIERKHDKLSIDEVLGFIDNCTQNYGCRILLILNTDKLGDLSVWEKFREKVIDQELRLETSPGEAFVIAAKLTPTKFYREILAAAEICQITNIRIIRKVLRTVNRILRGYDDLSPEVLDRVIPSMVLLAAIHYKGLDDGPDIDFVLDRGSSFDSVLARRSRKKEQAEEETEETKSRARWTMLLSKLKINVTDDFELLVAEFLKSGLLDASAVQRIIASYVSETNALAARKRSHEFFERCFWHPELSDADLLEEASGLLAHAALLDAFTITAVYDQTTALANGAEVADKMIASWIDHFRSKKLGPDKGGFEDFNLYKQRLHPLIEAEFSAIQLQLDTNMTLLEVCRSVVERRTWGPREEAAMKASTPRAYEAAIKSLTGSDLKLLLLANIDMYIHRTMYEPKFGAAMNNFVAACKTIVAQDDNRRRVTLIRNRFNGSNLSSQLDDAGSGPANGGVESGELST
jgi:hypothetical protein